MQHYFNPMSRAVTTHWMLKELEVDHDQITLDFQAGDTQTAEFRTINPMGKVPTLVDDGVVVTEAAAICAYLADKYIEKGLAPPFDSPQRGRYYRYLFFPGTTLEPMFSAKQFGLTDYSAVSAGWGDFERCMAAIEAMTPDTGWVLESGFSAADVVFGGTLDFAMQFGWLDAPSSKVMGYVNRIRERPAYQESHVSP